LEQAATILYYMISRQQQSAPRWEKTELLNYVN